MRYSIALFLILILAVSFSGCNTLKGAADGFSQDWEQLQKADDWLQKNAW